MTMSLKLSATTSQHFSTSYFKVWYVSARPFSLKNVSFNRPSSRLIFQALAKRPSCDDLFVPGNTPIFVASLPFLYKKIRVQYSRGISSHNRFGAQGLGEK